MKAIRNALIEFSGTLRSSCFYKIQGSPEHILPSVIRMANLLWGLDPREALISRCWRTHEFIWADRLGRRNRCRRLFRHASIPASYSSCQSLKSTNSGGQTDEHSS
jgi:hypothetical protein